MEKIEAVGFPGYYEIPGYSRYAITPSGVVINKMEGSFLQGSPNPDGYHNFRLVGDNGKTLTWGRHRLLGFVFKHPGFDVSELVINHENTIKGDDRLSNLEWATYQGNAEHAGAMGVTEKCLPISVRDANTGVVVKFPSIVECARQFGMTKDAINYRVQIGESRVFPERKQYRRGHHDTPWYIPESLENDLMSNGTSKRTLVRFVQTNQIVEFDQLGQLSAHLGVSPATITLWINQPNQPVLPGLIQIKWANDPFPWRAIGDPYLELEQYTKMRVVIAREQSSGRVEIFLSAAECAKAKGLNTTTLNYRLKSAGGKTYPDGFSYAYYSDYSRSY